MYKIGVYIPKQALEEVKAAMFAAGAGKIGNYDCCCWQTSGEGQFRPLTGSTPFIGETDKVDRVEEYRVEMVCDEACISSVMAAMKQSHPYEEPAFDVIKLVDLL